MRSKLQQHISDILEWHLQLVRFLLSICRQVHPDGLKDLRNELQLHLLRVQHLKAEPDVPELMRIPANEDRKQHV